MLRTFGGHLFESEIEGALQRLKQQAEASAARPAAG
jgi:hypothetical protein